MKPHAYALCNSQGYWIGIWREREIAERVKKKGKYKEDIVEVYTMPTTTYRRRLIRVR